MKRGVIIQASSRSNGNTFKIVSYLKEQTGFDCIDLCEYEINHFNYDFKHAADDFSALFKKIVQNYDVIIFATPIYWYTMSGLLKVFLDRISDFFFTEKKYGKLLNGKQMATISCGSSSEIFEGFTMPFIQTAKYLKMEYLGHLHTWTAENELSDKTKDNIIDFVVNQIKK